MCEKICKNCEYWKAAKDAPYRWNHSYNSGSVCKPHDFDTGKPMKFPFDVKICTHPKLLFCERPLEPDGFSVVDGSEYFAALVTAEEFGCVLPSIRKDNG